jgi:hypothetical protein
MNTRMNKLLVVLIAAMLLAQTLPVFAVTANEPHDANAMWFEPSAVYFDTGNATIGTRFNVTVWLNISASQNYVGVFGYQLQFLYDNVNLDYVTSDYAFVSGGPSDFFTGHQVQTAQSIDELTGTIQYYESCKGSDNVSVPRVGSLVWIEFEILTIPAKGLTIGPSTFDMTSQTPANNWVKGLDSSSALVSIDFTAYDATYTFEWKKPTAQPYFAVDPALKEFGPDPPSAIGAAFDVKVYIKNLALAWGMTNASFRLTYNSILIEVLGGLGNITGNTVDFNFTATFVSGQIDVVVNTTKTLGTPPDILVVTIKFTVIHQEDTPPYPVYPWAEISPLTISDYQFFDHIQEIPAGNPANGEVKIYALRTLEYAWIEIIPATVTKGPDDAIGQTFTVDVVCKNLDEGWRAVLYQFRVVFDASLIMPTMVTEGPLWQDPTWNLHGTFFQAPWEEDPIYGWNIVVFDMLMPNASIYNDITEFPHCDNVTGGVLATIEFEVVGQNKLPCNPGDSFLDCNITLLGFWEDGSQLFVNQYGDPVPSAYEKYGYCYYRIYDTPSTGRFIDLYGGAYNAGYGAYPFPKPYGGQGPNMPMDIVIPQSEVRFFVKVEYNCWPVQSKDVGFEIEGPFIKNASAPGGLSPKFAYKIWAKFTARTGTDGVAIITYRMPWPCEDPESLTGIWLVTATVNLADVIITDTLKFYYEHMVYITKVTATPYYVYHDENINVCVEWETHAMQNYTALFAVVITDELGVPFGMDASTNITIGGAVWCTWTTGRFCVDIYVPKWAFSGWAYIHVSVYDKDPTDGGFAYGQEYAPAPMVYILPTAPPTVTIEPVEATLNQTHSWPAHNMTIDYTATASGGWPGYTYAWYVNTIYLGITTSSWTLVCHTYMPVGTYDVIIKCVVTDYFGRTAFALSILHITQ